MNCNLDTEQQSVSSKSWLNFLAMEWLFVIFCWWCKSHQRTQKALLKVSWSGFHMERKNKSCDWNAKVRLKEEQCHIFLSWWKPKCRRCIFSLLPSQETTQSTWEPHLLVRRQLWQRWRSTKQVSYHGSKICQVVRSGQKSRWKSKTILQTSSHGCSALTASK